MNLCPVCGNDGRVEDFKKLSKELLEQLERTTMVLEIICKEFNSRGISEQIKYNRDVISRTRDYIPANKIKGFFIKNRISLKRYLSLDASSFNVQNV